MSNNESMLVNRRSVLRLAAGGAVGLSGLAGLPVDAFASKITPPVLLWGSSSLGSTGYVIIETLSAMVNKKTKIRSSSMSTSGGGENMALIGEGVIHLGQTTSSDWPAAIKGEKP